MRKFCQQQALQTVGRAISLPDPPQRNQEAYAKMLTLLFLSMIAMVWARPVAAQDATGEPVANPNVLYLAMTNTFEPFTDVSVRQAIAMGIDRQRIVDNFYAEGATVPSRESSRSAPEGRRQTTGEPHHPCRG